MRGDRASVRSGLGAIVPAGFPNPRSGSAGTVPEMERGSPVFTERMTRNITTALEPTANKITGLAVTAIVISLIALVIAVSK